MKARKYRGILPAFYACYTDEGEVCPERTRSLARHLAERGVQGLYVGGSSGECIYQSPAERKKILEAVMDEVGDELLIIAHVACNNTRDSVELARHAESLGVDAIAAIPPIYFPLSDAAVGEYWNTISAAAPQTDFIIYNIPQLAGTALSPSLLRSMQANPRLIGVKNSSMPVYDIQIFKRIGGEDFTVFNGPDEQFVAGRMMGAEAGIGGTYALMPELFLAAENALRKGDFASAQAIQKDINANIEALLGHDGNLYAMIKAVLNYRFDLEFGGVRSPMPNCSAADRAKVPRLAEILERSLARWS